MRKSKILTNQDENVEDDAPQHEPYCHIEVACDGQPEHRVPCAGMVRCPGCTCGRYEEAY